MLPPTVSGTQNYSVTSVSDANCPMGGTASGTATVFVSTSGPIGGVGTITSAANEACLNTVLLITTTPVSGQNIRYSWNTGSNSGVVLYSTSPGGPFVAPPFETVAPQVYAQFGSLGTSSGYNVCTFGTNGCGSTNNRCI
ncbi:MAG: hypothetical protein IPP71_08450 [Bacteroidetes bacterium]|nr:hypothetical protein [Bacteroidota bacterium]